MTTREYVDLEDPKHGQVLDQMGNNLTILKNMGESMNSELKMQNVELTGLEEDIDEGKTNMDIGMKKMRKLLKGGCPRWTLIGMLVVTIIVLIIVIGVTM